MDINNSNHTDFSRLALPLSVRITLIVSAIVLVTGGLFWIEEKQIGSDTAQIQPLHIPTAQVAENTDNTVAVIEETPSPPSWHSIILPEKTALTTLLEDNQLSKDDIRALTSLAEIKQISRHLQPGSKIELLTDEQNKLYGFRAPYDQQSTLNVSREDNQFTVEIIHQPIFSKNIVVNGVINGSLLHSAQSAGVPHNIILQLANIMAWKINFSKDLHLGDSFTIVYSQDYVGDKKINNGTILGGEIHLQTGDYDFVEFTDAHHRINYYSPTGHSLKSEFLRTPLHYTRISSGFSMSRMQPLLHFKRPHLGVDLAAPRGTPIEASGDGVIAFIGRDAGYGNLIIIDHGHGITTRYGHIQRFVRGMKKGSYVKEGETIAFVGSSGLATGPHLHYEFRIDGVAHDPLKVKLPGGQPISNSEKSAFYSESHRLLQLMDRDTHQNMG